MNKRRFSRPGRTENEQVLAANQADSEQVDDFVFADKIAFHGLEHFGRKTGGDFNWCHDWSKSLLAIAGASARCTPKSARSKSSMRGSPRREISPWAMMRSA